MIEKNNSPPLEERSSLSGCHPRSYIPKVEMSADFALQSKKNLRKKRVNLDAKILRQKCVNYQNPENVESEGNFLMRIYSVFMFLSKI